MNLFVLLLSNQRLFSKKNKFIENGLLGNIKLNPFHKNAQIIFYKAVELQLL